MIKSERLAQVLIEITDALIGDGDPGEFLQLVTTCSASLSRAPWAGVVLAAPHGQMQLAAASTESAALNALFELDTFEGPWLDCCRTGSPIVNVDLTPAIERWPDPVSRAVIAEFAMATALPLHGRRNVVGALILVSPDLEPLTPRDVRNLQAVADLTAVGLRQLGPPTQISTTKTAGARPHPDLAAHPTAPPKPDLTAVAVPAALLTPAEVATLFHVNSKTITKWARTGRLPYIQTLGGHHRYHHAEVARLLIATETPS